MVGPAPGAVKGGDLDAGLLEIPCVAVRQFIAADFIMTACTAAKTPRSSIRGKTTAKKMRKWSMGFPSTAEGFGGNLAEGPYRPAAGGQI